MDNVPQADFSQTCDSDLIALQTYQFVRVTLGKWRQDGLLYFWSVMNIARDSTCVHSSRIAASD